MVLAHSTLLEGAAGPRPRLLLLDEVAAHLDAGRREALFERLRVGCAQVWLTGTETGPFSAILGEAVVWHVRDGTVVRA
jgi:DNA replication and repair protein RecF